MTLKQLDLLTDEIEQVLNKYGLQIAIATGQFGDNPELAIRVEPIEKKLYSKCIRCGRTLKNPIAQERGYGDVCWNKQLHDNQSKLF